MTRNTPPLAVKEWARRIRLNCFRALENGTNVRRRRVHCLWLEDTPHFILKLSTIGRAVTELKQESCVPICNTPHMEHATC